jgi:hypothetical protein
VVTLCRSTYEKVYPGQGTALQEASSYHQQCNTQSTIGNAELSVVLGFVANSLLRLRSVEVWLATDCSSLSLQGANCEWKNKNVIL